MTRQTTDRRLLGDRPASSGQAAAAATPLEVPARDQGVSAAEEHEDDRLMLLAGAGQRSAFALLVTRHQDAVLRLCTLLVQEASVGEELAQETFVRLWQARARYRPQGSLRRYLFAIARNLCRSELRRRLRRLLHLDGPSCPCPPAAESPGDVLIDRAERAALVGAALQRLPERLRLALLLRFRDGFAYAEIAAALGCPVPTARTRVHYGLKALADLLPPEVLP